MMTHLVVEGQLDREILGLLLADLHEADKLKFYIGGGKDNARPWARRLQLDKHEPVALVVDSDRPDEKESASERLDLESYLRWSSGGVPYHVCLFVPTIERIFFGEKVWLETVLGREVNESLFRAGTYAPKQILSDILRDVGVSGPTELLGRFDKGILQQIRTLPPVAELRAFIEDPWLEDARTAVGSP